MEVLSDPHVCTGVEDLLFSSHDPSTPPEPAPPDPSLGNSVRDPRSAAVAQPSVGSMVSSSSSASKQQRILNRFDNSTSSLESSGYRRLVKASTMPAGSHTSLEDITCTENDIYKSTLYTTTVAVF